MSRETGLSKPDWAAAGLWNELSSECRAKN